MAVLYRKYRPQVFGEVLGQKPIIKTLQNQLKQGQVAHAYLFTGSRGVGKTSVARILAKAVNCMGSSQQSAVSNRREENSKQGAAPDVLGDACGQCGVCKAVEQGNFIDLIEIDAASNTGVDNVRDIIEHVKFSPSSGKYKVFIIDEVHMLSKGAFNALLKTLEEPPKHAIFILATTEIQKVPATIISRTQRFDFKAPQPSELFAYLKKIAQKEGLDYGDEILNLVAANAQGSVRDAMSILDKISTLGSKATISDIRAVLGITDSAWLRELGELIVSGKAREIPEFFDRLLENGADVLVFNKDFLEYLRKCLVYKLNPGGAGGEGVAEIAGQAEINDLIFAIRLFLRALKDSQGGSGNSEIPLLLSAVEAAMKKAPRASLDSPSHQQPENKQPAENLKKTLAEKALEETKERVLEEQNMQTEALDGASHEEVAEFWPRVVAKIKERNGPLGSLLKASRLLSVENGTVILVVKYQFDKKTLEKNSQFIAQLIKEVSGKTLQISAQVASAGAQSEAHKALDFSDALRVFGGELVE